MAAAAAELRRVFPADLDAPTAARRAIADLAAKVDPETRFRLELLVTELVSNSVVHGETGRVDLDVRINPRQVRVTVVDDGPGFDPGHVSSDGYGLVMLGKLADRWGFDRRGGRTAVWFLLRRGPTSRAAAAAVHYAGRVAAALLGRRRQSAVDPYSD